MKRLSAITFYYKNNFFIKKSYQILWNVQNTLSETHNRLSYTYTA